MTEAGCKRLNEWRGHQSKGQGPGDTVMSKSEAEMSLLNWMDDCYSQQCYIASCLPSCRLPPLNQVINPQPLRAFSYLLKGNSKTSVPYDLVWSGLPSLFQLHFHHSFPSLSNAPSLTSLLSHKYSTNTWSMLPSRTPSLYHLPRMPLSLYRYTIPSLRFKSLFKCLLHPGKMSLTSLS